MWNTIGEDIRTIVVGALAIAVAAAIVWAANQLRVRIFGKSVDFVLHKRGTAWALERTKRAPAYPLISGDGALGISNVSALDSLASRRFGDVERGAMVDAGESSQMWFSWIDGHRMVSRSILLGDGDRYEVVGRRTKPGRSTTT